MRPTRINWTNFLKVYNDEETAIEGAMCKDCRKVLKTVTEARLEGHRKSCPSKLYANSGNAINHPEGADDAMDTDTVKNSVEDIEEIKKSLDEELGLFFYSSSTAFVQVENAHLLKFIHKLCNLANIKYTPPARKTLAGRILRQIQKKFAKMKKLQLEGTDAVLIVDGWCNKSVNRKYLVFSVRNENTFQTFLTFFDISIETETGKNLAEYMNKAIDIAKKDYDCNIFAIISDNDPKILKGARLAMNGTLIQCSCSSHSANLLIKLFVTPELLQILQEVLRYFKEPKLAQLLKKMNGSMLKSYPETRFCYLRDSCKSILDNLEHLKKVCLIKDVIVSETIKNNLYSDAFKNELVNTIDNLNPICKLINKCQDRKCNIADATQLWLSLTLPSNDFGKNIAERIKKSLWEVGYAANLLHHKYNGQLLNNEQKAVAEKFILNHFCPEAKNEYIAYQVAQHQLLANYAGVGNDSIAYWIHIGMNSNFKQLSKEAIKLMIIPASTALLEGLFSNWTYVHNLYRNRLGHEKSAILLDIYYSCKNNLYNIDLMNESMIEE